MPETSETELEGVRQKALPLLWTRIFRSGFTPESVILYTFGILLALTLTGFLAMSDYRMAQALADLRQHRPPGLVEGSPLAKEMANRYLEIQIDLNLLRYKYASTALASRAGRTNAAFLIGATIALMGSFMVIRGVKDSESKGDLNWKENITFRFAMTSPGTLTLLFGTVVIVVTLMSREKLDVMDSPIVLYGAMPTPGTAGAIKGSDMKRAQELVNEYLREGPIPSPTSTPNPLP